MLPADQADIIQVRLDEQFDETRLADYLRGRLPGADNPLTVRQFSGGAANLTYLLDYGRHEYVLRRPPLGPVAESAHDMGREYKVLSVLHHAFPYAPQAFLYCEDREVIGAPFFIMERRHGVVTRQTMPQAFADKPQAPRQMSRALVDVLAAFHAVDYVALGLEDLGKPVGFIERQVEGWYRRWQKAKTKEVPEMEAVHRWLADHLPQTADFTLVHNDYKLDNVMFAPNDPGHVTAVFDWDMCTLGDPLSDVGALLTYWSQPDDPPHMQAIAMMPVGEDLPFYTRRELMDRYAAQSGRSLDDIRFYHALGLFRLAVIIAQIYIRYRRGQTQDPRFAQLDQMIPLVAQAAQELVL